MSKNYKYFYNPIVMSFGIICGGVGGNKVEVKVKTKCKSVTLYINLNIGRISPPRGVGG